MTVRRSAAANATSAALGHEADLESRSRAAAARALAGRPAGQVNGGASDATQDPGFDGGRIAKVRQRTEGPCEAVGDGVVDIAAIAPAGRCSPGAVPAATEQLSHRLLDPLSCLHREGSSGNASEGAGAGVRGQRCHPPQHPDVPCTPPAQALPIPCTVAIPGARSRIEHRAIQVGAPRMQTRARGNMTV